MKSKNYEIEVCIHDVSYSGTSEQQFQTTSNAPSSCLNKLTHQDQITQIINPSEQQSTVLT